MQLDTEKSIRAIFIAPLSAGIGWVIANALSSDVFNMLSLVFSIFPLSYPFALVATLVLGLPSYLLMKYLNVLNFYTLSLAGLPLGFLSAVITGDLNDPVWLKTAWITGLVVSTTAALVMVKKPNKIKNENAASGTDAQKDARPF